MGKLEKKLAPKLASITYCSPPTLGNSLLNYRKIAHTSDQEQSNKTKNVAGAVFVVILRSKQYGVGQT